MIDFRLNLIQSIKTSAIALVIICPNLIASEAIAGALSGAKSFTGKINYTVTGGSLRSNPDDIDACSLSSTSTASLSNLPNTDVIKTAYLYWSGSGESIDNQINFGGSSLTADKTFSTSFFLSDPSFGDHNYYFFQGVKDVTDVVKQQGNGNYQLSNLTVDNSLAYCNVEGVLAGWALVVVYEDSALPANKINTIQLYDGLEVSRNQTVNYTLSGIEVAPDPIAKFSMLVWEGDESLGGTTESFAFNNNTLTDTYNPLQNQFNSSINTNQSITTYGVDFDTFDVSSYVTEGDTSITGTITTADDLVLQGAALMMVTNTVFSD
ncbi:MAG: hypothetical protein AAGE84_17295 [Cyanobacteria bacterium P01_G01_bin.39]